MCTRLHGEALGIGWSVGGENIYICIPRMFCKSIVIDR